MSAISFKPNVPAFLALKDAGAVPEGSGWRYTLVDGRDLVVSQQLAVSINLLELSPGETFGICRYWDGDAQHTSEWNVWRTPESEKARAAAEIAAANGDLAPLLEQSVRIVERRKQAKISQPAAIAPQGTGTHGPVPVAHRPPAAATGPARPPRIPYNVALREVLGFVTEGLRDAGEQWNDQAKQDLVSTVLIQAAKDGHLALWERKTA